MRTLNQKVKLGQRVHQLPVIGIRILEQQFVGNVRIGDELLEVVTSELDTVWTWNRKFQEVT